MDKGYLPFKYLVHVFEEEKDRLNEQIWKYTEIGKKEGRQNERKVALIIDDLLDYVAETRIRQSTMRRCVEPGNEVHAA